MAQRYKFSVESKSFPLDLSGEPFIKRRSYKEDVYKQKKRLVQDATNLMRDFVKKTSKSKNCLKDTRIC